MRTAARSPTPPRHAHDPHAGRGVGKGLRRASAPPDHGVQLYRNVGELATTVADYLAAGFERGEPAVVVATPEHWQGFAERLSRSGWQPATVEEQGLLVRVDAETTLAAIMADGMPSGDRFDRVVGGLLDGVGRSFPHRQVRAFGEMVDLLSRQGNPRAAVALEEHWHRLGQERRFSLLCGYRVDIFDGAAQTSLLPDVCRAHSHVLPADEPDRLRHAVDSALEEALGSAGADRVYSMIAGEMHESSTPAAQLALMWVSAEMPAAAEQILAAARSQYFAQPAA